MEDEQGSFFSFQVGAATGDKNQIDVTIGGMGANILGFATPAADDAADAATDDGGSDTPAATGDPIVSIVGDTLTVDGAAAAAGDLVIEFSTGASDVSVTLTGSETTSEIATAIAGAVNSSDAGSGTATDNGDGTVTFDFSSAGGDYTNAVPSISSDTDVAQAVAADDSGSDSDTDSGSGDSDSATPAAVDVPTAPVTSVATADDARVTIKAIDKAIMTVNIQRSELGAVSNRLSHTVNNLTNISSNLSAAQGGIEDADFAHETTMLAKKSDLAASLDCNAGPGQRIEAECTEPTARLSVT
jgi:flagellin